MDWGTKGVEHIISLFPPVHLFLRKLPVPETTTQGCPPQQLFILYCFKVPAPQFSIIMAPIGPLARLFAQLVVPVVAVLARAIPAAYSQALQNARKSGMDANTAAQATNFLRKTMTKEEALQVLNLAEKEATAEAIVKW